MVLAVFLGLTGIAISYSVHQRADAASQDRLQGLVFGILGATNVSDSGELSVSMGELPERTLALEGAGLYAEIVDSDGMRLWRSRSIIESVPPVRASAIGDWQQELVKLANGDHARRIQLQTVWEQDNGAELPFIVHVVDARGDDVRAMARFNRSLWATLLGVAAVLLVLQLAVLRAALGPLRKLGRDIDAMTQGNKEVLEEDFPKELSPLATSVNALHARERGRHESYRHLLDDLAHNLKTPLAILHNLDDSTVSTQANSMQRSIDRYLQRAATETTTTLTPSVLLLPVLERVAESMRKLHQNPALQFEHDISPTAALRAPEADVYEVIGNLYDNACKYGAHHIRTRLHDGVLSIEDDGPGFDADNPQDLLTRGARADAFTEGKGIGLATVKQFVVAWGGEVQLARSDLGGARCSLTLRSMIG